MSTQKFEGFYFSGSTDTLLEGHAIEYLRDKPELMAALDDLFSYYVVNIDNPEEGEVREEYLTYSYDFD